MSRGEVSTATLLCTRILGGGGGRLGGGGFFGRWRSLYWVYSSDCTRTKSSSFTRLLEVSYVLGWLTR